MPTFTGNGATWLILKHELYIESISADGRVGNCALIEKVAANQLAAVTCPRSLTSLRPALLAERLR